MPLHVSSRLIDHQTVGEHALPQCSDANGEERRRKKFHSAAGNRTPVSRVTGGDTNHYTTADILHPLATEPVSGSFLACLQRMTPLFVVNKDLRASWEIDLRWSFSSDLGR